MLRKECRHLRVILEDVRIILKRLKEQEDFPWEEWQTAGWKDKREAIRWWIYGWEDPLAALKFYKAGWKVEQNPLSWYKAGWTNAVLARQWRRWGWKDATEALRWKKVVPAGKPIHSDWGEYFTKPEDALPWLETGLTPWEAYVWFSKGFSPDEAVKWRKAGVYEPEKVRVSEQEQKRNVKFIVAVDFDGTIVKGDPGREPFENVKEALEKIKKIGGLIYIYSNRTNPETIDEVLEKTGINPAEEMLDILHLYEIPYDKILT
ncbi:MAG: hypothetical protein QXI58_02580, partial [Candidatus Micrarchaeia archaeon]